MNIGLVGYGRWGKNIYRVLSELGTLHSVYDIAEDVPHWVDSYESMLADKYLDAIIIATPASTHFELARQALLAGKHVLIEKPMALHFADGMELIGLAWKKEKILMVGHLLQYHPAIGTLKQLIRRGTLGRLRYLYSTRCNLGSLRTNENVMWSFAPHDISVILSLLGSEPTSVGAFGGDYMSPGIFDITVLTLGFPDGVKAHIYVSWLHPRKIQELIVVGSEAMATFDGVKNELTVQRYHSDGTNLNNDGATTVEIPEGEPLRIEIQHFLDCIENNVQPLTDGAEGLRVLNVLTDAEHALKSNP